jgi:hypothetical protein
MDDSEHSRMDEGDDEDTNEASSLADADAFGWAPGDSDHRAADGVLGGGAGLSADDGADHRSRQGSHREHHAPVAAAAVISDFLGHRDAADLIAEGEGLDVAGGISAPAWEGMSLEEGEALLEHYGIDAHVEHGDLSSLARYVQEGRSVMLAVDANELHGQDDDSSHADRGADHALLISKIDEEAGVAILHDPRDPGGEGYEVSMDTLQDAWADSGNGMVVTDTAATDWQADPTVEHGPRTDAGADRIRAWGPAGAVILPIVLAARARLRRRARL